MKKTIICFSCLFVGTIAIAQTSVNTSGGEVNNASCSLSYSIGQVAYMNVSNESGSLSQGVQQTYQISTLNLEEKAFNFSLSAFPNPTQDNLNLRVGNYRHEQLVYRLLDTEGKLLSEVKVQNEETVIEMRQLPNATYFVEINHEGKKVQLFKIIKNQ
jgi:hypothetical protein